jgi:glutaminase
MTAVNYQQILAEAAKVARATPGRGRVADYIPALAEAPAEAFGMAMTTADGKLYYGAEDREQPFSIQSISKLFTLVLAIAHGGDALWQGMGREPSGNPFNP